MHGSVRPFTRDTFDFTRGLGTCVKSERHISESEAEFEGLLQSARRRLFDVVEDPICHDESSFDFRLPHESLPSKTQHVLNFCEIIS